MMTKSIVKKTISALSKNKDHIERMILFSIFYTAMTIVITLRHAHSEQWGVVAVGMFHIFSTDIANHVTNHRIVENTFGYFISYLKSKVR